MKLRPAKAHDECGFWQVEVGDDIIERAVRKLSKICCKNKLYYV